MGSTNQDKDGNVIITIQESLSAYEVGPLKEQMLDGLQNHNGLVLDIDAVSECDTLGIQLLYSAGKTARGLNKNFMVTGKSQACWEAALRIGLEPDDYLISSEEA